MESLLPVLEVEEEEEVAEVSFSLEAVFLFPKKTGYSYSPFPSLPSPGGMRPLLTFGGVFAPTLPLPSDSLFPTSFFLCFTFSPFVVGEA